MKGSVAAKAKVLLVDDERDLVEAIRDAISDYFEDVYTACSVEEAIALLRSKQIDVVLSDFRMPGRDGLDLRDYVHEHHPNVVFFMLTGYASDPKITEALRVHKFMVLDKPAHPTTIVDRISSSLYQPEMEPVIWDMYKAELSPSEALEFRQLPKDEQVRRLQLFMARTKQSLKKKQA